MIFLILTIAGLLALCINFFILCDLEPAIPVIITFTGIFGMLISFGICDDPGIDISGNLYKEKLANIIKFHGANDLFLYKNDMLKKTIIYRDVLDSTNFVRIVEYAPIKRMTFFGIYHGNKTAYEFHMNI